MTYIKYLPETGFLRLSQIIGDPKTNTPPIIPVCRATIYNWTKDGKFPKPVRLSSAISAWRAEDIRSFIEHGGCATQLPESIGEANGAG